MMTHKCSAVSLYSMFPRYESTRNRLGPSILADAVAAIAATVIPSLSSAID